MRILFISAFYPPNTIGGWEQLVEDIDIRLQKRGHETYILTSSDRPGSPSKTDQHVSRNLTLESDLVHYQPVRYFWGRKQRNTQNTLVLENAIKAFRPDLIFIHVMWNLWKGIPWYAEQRMAGKVVYYVADDWPYVPNIHQNYWQLDANHGFLHAPKRVLGASILKSQAQEDQKYRLRFEHVICVSENVRGIMTQRLGLNPDHVCVVRNGVEVDRFLPMATQSTSKGRSGSLSLLYAGSLVPAKGVHTAVEAMSILAQRGELRETHLTLVGSGHPDYEEHLRKIIAQNRLSGQVSIQGRIPRQAMPDLLRRFDAFVFPSLGEALPRAVQEALACGLPVIGTTVGGTGEILIEGETGLTFLPGDAIGLADQIHRLMESPELYDRLASRGSSYIRQNFDIEKTVERIEEYLLGMMRA